MDLPSSLSVASPDRPIRDMDVVEESSEAVANRMVDFSDKLRRRDFEAALAWLAPGFVGHAFAPLEGAEVDDLPVGARRTRYDTTTAPIVERHGFLEAIRERIGAWERVETVVWKVKGAEFQSVLPPWGRVRFKVSFQGTAAGGGPASIEAWGFARTERGGGQWLMSEFELESLFETTRPAYLFTEVSTGVGLARTGIRFGKPGNQSFAWNGAAAGDVDGDGLVDIFVPSPRANHLYMARGETGFVDEAVRSGIAHPAGGTGAVFFDMDNDGDQDLALADVGWTEPDGRLSGNRLRLWVSERRSAQADLRFEERGESLGFKLAHGYSLTVFDAEQNGFLDVFVANYGRVEAHPNNSWIQATNGTPNQFYTNVFEADGTRFVEVAEARGLIDTSWSYASAAADIDVDGDTDLYVANDYGVNHLWINGGKGVFENQAEVFGISDLGNGMGASFGDLNNDAQLDLYVSNMSSTAGRRILGRLAQKDDRWTQLVKMAAGNTIFFADEKGFERVPSEKGGIGGSWAWNSNLFDLDLDGRLDLYCCSGFVTGDTPADT